MDLQIVHRPEAGQFTLDLDGHRGWIDYRVEPGHLVILHTHVPVALGGRGLGARLVRAVLAQAHEDGLRVRSVCDFATRVAARDPDYAGLLDRTD